jgi:hypothetical protein
MTLPWPTCFRALALAGLLFGLLVLSRCQTAEQFTVAEVVERKVEIPKSLLTCVARRCRCSQVLQLRTRLGGRSGQVCRYFKRSWIS